MSSAIGLVACSKRKAVAMASKVVAMVSGGLDSATLLWQLVHDGHEVVALSFDYGQRHRRELAASSELAKLAGCRHVESKLELPGASALQSGTDVPDGHYEDASMRATVVPSRNLVMLSVASAYAVSERAKAVAYAAHGGDHAIYPDCRVEFVRAAADLLAIANWEPIDLLAPFVTMTKSDIVTLGATLGVPFGQTWSCYKGGAIHCGTCGTCVERREAFALAGIHDPTEYAA